MARPRGGEVEYVDGASREEMERRAAGDIALLDDPIFNSYKWSVLRLRTPDEISRESQGGEWEFVATKIGQIDEEWARANLGGGTFEFRGYYDDGDGTGRTMKRKPIIVIAGPRRNFAAPPTPPAAAATAAPPANGELSRGERMLLKHMRMMDQRLERLERTPAPTAPTSDYKPPSLLDLAETLKTLKGLSGPEPTRNPDIEVVKTYIGMIEQGIALGQDRGPMPAGEAGADWGKIAEVGAGLVERLMMRAAQARRGQAAAPRSSATVVDEPPPPPPAPAAPAISHRWETAFESLAGAIAEAEDPADFAVTLERILNSQELASIRLDPDQALEKLSRAAEALPILKTGAGQAYIHQVFLELNRPVDPEDGSQPASQ